MVWHLCVTVKFTCVPALIEPLQTMKSSLLCPHWNCFWCYRCATLSATLLLLRVQWGHVHVCVSLFFFLFFCEQMWMSSTVSMVANPKRRMLIMEATTWEDPRYACHYLTAGREIVCVWPLSLVRASLSVLASCMVSLTRIKIKKSLVPETPGKSANTTEK